MHTVLFCFVHAICPRTHEVSSLQGEVADLRMELDAIKAQMGMRNGGGAMGKDPDANRDGTAIVP